MTQVEQARKKIADNVCAELRRKRVAAKSLPDYLGGSRSSWQLSYGKNGDQAEDVFTTTTKPFEGSIAKGKAKTATYGFAVTKKGMADVSVEVTPGMEYESVIFEGKIV